MAQTNFTPILLYASSTPTNVPTAGNLTNSTNGAEIAINIADKNLFFKDSGGTVNTVPIRQSSTSSNGWLSNTDWNTFNGKAPATSGTSLLYGNGSGGFSNVTIGTGITFAGGTLSATGSGGTITSVTGTSPVVSSGGTTPAISLATAYGDTLNPYASKTAKYVLAAPNGSAGVPTFRQLANTDITGFGTMSTQNANSVAITGGTLNGVAIGGTTAGDGTFDVLTGNTSRLGIATGTSFVATNGLSSTSTFTGTAPTDGIVIDYSTGYGRFSAFTGDGYQWYTGGIGTTKIMDLSSAGALVTSGTVTANGVLLTGNLGTVTSVTGTSPVVSSGGTTPAISMPAATTSVSGYLTSTDWNTFNSKQPAGSYLTAVSVVSANGFAGTSSGGTTPALTLSTSITGILKGNGTAISAATSGTDYAPATSGSSILYGNSAGGFSNVTIGTGLSFTGGTLSSTLAGGTVTSVAATVPAFLSIAGSPITTSGTLAISYSGTALPVANGGTGLTSLTAGYIPYGNGTSAFSSSGNLTFDGSNFATTGTASAAKLIPTGGGATGNGMYLPASNEVAISTNSVERMRYYSDGTILSGTTDSSFFAGSVTGVGIYSTNGFIAASRNGALSGLFNRYTSDGDVVQFRRSGTAVGSVSVTTVATLYNTTSDYRLKTVIGAVTDAGQRIDALEPIEYDFKTGGRTRGFLAHKFAEIYPSSVNGEKDAIDEDGTPIYQSMQASSAEVMADLISEIQSLRARVAALESK